MSQISGLPSELSSVILIACLLQVSTDGAISLITGFLCCCFLILQSCLRKSFISSIYVNAVHAVLDWTVFLNRSFLLPKPNFIYLFV